MLKTVSAILGIAFVLAACDQAAQETATPPAPPPTKAWMVFFDTNSSKLSQQGSATVSEAAGVAKSIPNAKVTVTGYTDTDGSPAYNQALSVRRANAVKAELVHDGIDATAITVTGVGEQSLLVQTPNQTKQEKNRRVQIVVQ